MGSKGGGGSHTIAGVYVPEVMGTFVRYFVVFLFLEGLYLRPDSGATNMRRDRLTRFVRPRVRLHLRERGYSFVRQRYFAALLYPQ